MDGVNYSGRTNGLADMIDRRATWGGKKVRIVGIVIDENGAHAKFRIVGQEKIRMRPVTELRLVPIENIPQDGTINTGRYSGNDGGTGKAPNT